MKRALSFLMIGAGVLLASQKTAPSGVSQLRLEVFNPLKIFNPEPDYSIMYSDIRGLRNNNAGNIRHGDNWQGMAETQKDKSFITFNSPEWGVRAMAIILINYQRKHGLKTINQIIHRWAPPFENNSTAYAEHVARLLGVGVSEVISVKDHMLPLVKAIITHENGIQPYSDRLINDGLALV